LYPQNLLSYDYEGKVTKDVFILKYDGYSLGSVDIVRDTVSSYILPIQFFDALKIKYTELPDKKGVTVERDVYLGPITYNKYEKNSKVYGNLISFNKFEYKEVEGKVFLETNNFSKIFDINFTIFQDIREIQISKKQDLPELRSFIEGGVEKEAGPIDDESLQDNFSDDIDVEGLFSGESENLVFKEVESKKFTPVTEDIYDFQNLLIFEVGIGEQVYDQLVDVYEHVLDSGETAIYIHFEQFLGNLEFAIDINENTKIAEGWFIREENKIKWDFGRKILNINNRTESMKVQDFFFSEDGLFFLANNIKSWFPIDYEIRYGAQRVVIEPRVLLPFQEKKIREIKRNTTLSSQNKKEYPILETPYKLYQVPEADITLSTSLQDSDDEPIETSASFSALLSGDYLNYNMRTYVSGNDERLTSLRVSGEKKDINNNLFDQNISEFAFGDIPSYTAPLVSGSSLGLGASLSTYPVNRSENFDKTVIEGDIQPNWEVELFRNSQLLSFQTVGPEGRYKFEDVDILYGENIFKLVFYGPQGEIKEKIERIYIKDSLLNEDEYNYKFSVNKKNQTIANINSDNLEKNNRFVFQGEYGFSDEVTLSSTFVADEFINLQGERDTHLFQQMQYSEEILGGIANFNGAYNYNDNGLALKQSYITRLYDTSINFSNTYYNNFINESRALDSNPTKIETGLSLNRALNLPHLKNSYTSLLIDFEERQSGRKSYSATNSFSTVYNGYSLSNNLTARFDNNDNKNINGGFSLRTNANMGYYKFDARYSVHPETELDSISFSVQNELAENIVGRLDVNQSIDSQITNFNGSLNYLQEDYILSISTGIDTNANYSITANLSFSLYQDPFGETQMTSDISAESGSVKTYAYMDNNLNNEYDEDVDEILENVQFKRANKKIEPYGSKYGYLRSLPSYDPVDIILDTTSLDDPLWYPTKEGYSVVSRPGLTTEIGFPVVRTAEVDGVVYIESRIEGGDDGTISGLTVFLIDDKGSKVGEAISEFDGYFMFERVVPGRYFLHASETQLKDLGITQAIKPEFTVNFEDDYYPDNDIYLKN